MRDCIQWMDVCIGWVEKNNLVFKHMIVLRPSDSMHLHWIIIKKEQGSVAKIFVQLFI
jgi:hypothetical protein